MAMAYCLHLCLISLNKAYHRGPIKQYNRILRVLVIIFLSLDNWADICRYQIEWNVWKWNQLRVDVRWYWDFSYLGCFVFHRTRGKKDFLWIHLSVLFTLFPFPFIALFWCWGLNTNFIHRRYLHILSSSFAFWRNLLYRPDLILRPSIWLHFLIASQNLLRGTEISDTAEVTKMLMVDINSPGLEEWSSHNHDYKVVNVMLVSRILF